MSPHVGEINYAEEISFLTLAPYVIQYNWKKIAVTVPAPVAAPIKIALIWYGFPKFVQLCVVKMDKI